MALVLKDRVKETTTTTGTGTITLNGALTGFQSFSAVGNGNTTYYAISDPTNGSWEVGLGTYTSAGTTLSRTTILSSSNAGSLVNFTAGTKDVFVTYPSSKSVYQDASGFVGIGTTAPQAQLVVSNAGAQGVEITGSTGSFQVYNRSTSAYGTANIYANTFYVRTGASPAIKLTVDVNGLVLIGTTSASGNNLLQVNSDALINGLTVGRGAGAVSSNTAVGSSALAANTTGANNTAIGLSSLTHKKAASIATHPITTRKSRPIFTSSCALLL